jgi:uncharacterized phage-associated protein
MRYNPNEKGVHDMANVHDVAAYILKKRGPMSAMKLQKLVYYSQAWALVWDEEPLFDAKIEAWRDGPVIRILFDEHRGEYSMGTTWPKGDVNNLTQDNTDTIDSVLDYYGDKSGKWLSDLTHREDPWKLARQGVDDDAHCDREITHAAMIAYYGGL